MRRYARHALAALLPLLLTALCAAGQEASAQTAGQAERPGAEERLTFMREEGAREPSEAPSAAGTFARTVGALLIVVGLVVAAGWALRRFGGARFGSAPEGAPELRVLNSVGLGDRRSLLVVRFRGKDLLVGSTAQSITLLSADGEEADPPRATAGRSVAELLGGGGEADGPFFGGGYDFEDELSSAERRAAAAAAGGEA